MFKNLMKKGLGLTILVVAVDIAKYVLDGKKEEQDMAKLKAEITKEVTESVMKSLQEPKQ